MKFTEVTMLASMRFLFGLTILLISKFCYAQGFSFGYRLDYATSALNTSRIDSAFPDFNNGHTSAFFFRKYVDGNFYFEIAPGAWNSETSDSQFTYQYNTLGLGYQGGDSFTFEIGASVGGGLFALTTGSQNIGEVQTSATVLRKDSGIYTAQVGGGYKFGRCTVLLNLRYFGFLDSDLSKLNGPSAGFSIEWKP